MLVQKNNSYPRANVNKQTRAYVRWTHVPFFFNN